MGAALAGEMPPWARLPQKPGETLIVLWWGPGWYTVEGLEPGTRHLSTFLRHLSSPERLRELAADLARPANRWVLRPSWAEAPAEAVEVLERLYDPGKSWRGWTIWERRSRPGGRGEALVAPTGS